MVLVTAVALICMLRHCLGDELTSDRDKIRGCDDVCQSECIRAHNAYRLNYGVQPLLFNRQLANQAQAQIDKGILAHSDWVKTRGGENIAWGSIFPTFISAIKSWHDEKSYFDFETGKSRGKNHVIKNFIQLVWKGASKIGCARGSLYGKPWYIVHYDEAPNMDDPDAIIKENIGRPKEADMNWFRDSSPFAKDFENPKTV